MRVLTALLFWAASSLYAQTVEGIPRFSQVNDRLYRGGQPSEIGIKSLAKLGILTVLDLRPGGGPGSLEEREATALGMHYASIPMHGLHAPTDAEINSALALLGNPANAPIFVHCVHGVDRTGTVVACYRIRFNSWSSERAEREAEEHGMHRVERGMKKFILNFPHAPSKGGLYVAPQSH